MQDVAMLFGAIRDAFVRRSPLDPRNLGERVRDVSFGVMEEADIPLCLALYRDNEAAHFPPALAGRYEAHLRDGKLLNLVARRDGAPVGCGGVAYDAVGVAWFCFGMVAPSQQGRGVGTALFLARMAMLTLVDGWATIRMSSVPGAIKFHRRFGVLFTHSGTYPDGFSLAIGTLDVRAAEIEACRALLAERRITYPEAADKIPRAIGFGLAETT